MIWVCVGVVDFIFYAMYIIHFQSKIAGKFLKTEWLLQSHAKLKLKEVLLLILTQLWFWSNCLTFWMSDLIENISRNMHCNILWPSSAFYTQKKHF
jgi:hypothetical protein